MELELRGLQEIYVHTCLDHNHMSQHIINAVRTEKGIGGYVQRVTPHPKPFTNKTTKKIFAVLLKEYSHSFRHRPHPSARFHTNQRPFSGLSVLNYDVLYLYLPLHRPH